LVDTALEVKKTEFDATIRIQDPSKMQAFLDQETNMLKRMVDKLASKGANVVICQKGIDDMAMIWLSIFWRKKEY
jgi:chaperonin GroEL (HSP60 family)